MSSAGPSFAWTTAMVGERVGVYPPEEGNRARPWDSRVWAAVETLPRERLLAIQLERLQKQLAYVEATSPFYAERWRQRGVSARDVRSLDDLTRLPIVTKEDFELDQRANPPFGSAPTVPPHQQMKLWRTSGTTGAPRLWAETKEDWENGMYLYARSFYAHGVRPGWRGYFAFSYPPFIAFWLAHYAAEMMGCQAVPKGPLPTEAWLGMMRQLAGTTPGFMCATPTFAQRQVEVARRMGLDPRDLGIKVLSLAGEPGACVPATKAAIEQDWGAQVHDVLGSTETSGPVFFTCDAQAARAQPSDHANVDYFILEVLDRDTLQPAPEGQPGALCVTALGRTGMPAIRFLLNDYVQIRWESCPCGRTLPLVRGGVSARADDMLVIRGVNVYPSLFENLVRARHGLGTEYVLVQEGSSVSLRVEAHPDLRSDEYPALVEQLALDIRSATALTVPVEVLPPNSLPRSETKSTRLQLNVEPRA